MSYDAIDISRYVINYSIENGNPMSNLKLQKILYYIQAAFLIEKGKPCFKEPLISWRHGPVQEEVYYNYKTYMSREITDMQTKYLSVEFGGDFVMQTIEKVFDKEKIQINDRHLIEKVVDSYKDAGAWALVEKTHSENPWQETNRNEVIPISLIEKYFTNNPDRVYG